MCPFCLGDKGTGEIVHLDRWGNKVDEQFAETWRHRQCHEQMEPETMHRLVRRSHANSI